MNIKTALKTSVAAAALFAIAAPVATPANAADDTLSSGNKNNLKISGYVAKTLLYVDDGEDDALFVTDGSTSRTRVRWIANGTVNENVTAGAFIEMDIPLSNNRNGVNLGGAGPVGSGDSTESDSDSGQLWTVRHQVVWVQHKKFGKIRLGNTDPAGNGNAERTFSGTNMVDLSSAKPFAGANLFVNETTAGSETRLAGASVNATFDNGDGRSRTDVLRYDAPKFMGLGLAASYIAGGDYELGARWNGKFGPFRMVAAVVYDDSQATDTTRDNEISGSAAILHDSGLNAAIAGGVTNLDDAQVTSGGRSSSHVNDPNFYYFNVGYRAKIFGIGGTNFSFSWNHSNNQFASGGGHSSGDSIGFSVAQIFDPIGANMVLSYRNYSLDVDEDNKTFEDIDMVSLQTVFNF